MSEETQTTVEETKTIAEKIVETPATIQEDTVAESVPAEELVPEPETLPEPKRKPGRPSGSRNKQPAKPRAKKKVPVIVSEADLPRQQNLPVRTHSINRFRPKRKLK